MSARGTFCCMGCEAVFAALEENGLGDYYRCDVAPGVSQRAAAPKDDARFAALDDALVAGRYIEFREQGMTRATFSVPAMHCASCLWLLERLWRLHPGIVRADADLFRRTVRVTFRSDAVSLRRVAELLASIGYEPALDAERQPARMPPARRRLYLQMGVAGFAFGNIMLFSAPRYVNGAPLGGAFAWLFGGLNIALALPVLAYSAADYFTAAWHALRHRAMSLDVPIALGLTTLFLRSVFDIAWGRGEGFLDSFTGFVFFLLIGRLFQQKAFDRIAFDRTFRSFLPLSVRVEQTSGEPVLVPIERVAVGDRLVVRPGEIVPADASLLEDAGAVDLAFVTGEQRPVPVSCGDVVRAGGRVVGRALRLEVAREVSHSQLAGLWNNPAFTRRPVDGLARVSARFGAAFTLAAVGLALAGALLWWPDGRMAVQVATAVLIVACPCALTLAAPITLGTAMGMMGRSGLYLRNPGVALAMGRVDAVAFDKTGTLTSAGAGARLEAQGLTDADWRLVRRLAAESIHPVSRAIAATGQPSGQVTGCREVPGQGLRGTVDGHDVLLGSASFLAMETGTIVSADERRTGVAVDGRLRGWVHLVVPARAGVERAAGVLARSLETWLVSGDHPVEAPRWQPLFGARMRFRQSPEDKLQLVRDRQAAGRHVLMVGDGLNDAGALAAAEVGVAVSDDTACVVPACDAVVRGDRLEHLPQYLRFARHARRVIVICLAVSVAYNAIGIGLALAGLLTPLLTAILMPMSSLSIVGLSTAAMRWSARGALPAWV